MIVDSLSYLRRSDEALKTTLVGGLLLVFGFLLLPLFVVTGYFVRVLRRTAAGDETPPVFEDWEGLLVDGLKATVVSVVYFFVPSVLATGFVVAAVGAFLVVVPEGFPRFSSPLVGITVLAVVGLVVALVWLAGLYLGPAALANFADTGHVRAAFAVGTLLSVVTTRPYFVGWLQMVAVVLLGALVVGLLTGLTVLGSVGGLFVNFYFLVAAYYVLGRVWADVRPVGADRDGAVPSERPAV